MITIGRIERGSLVKTAIKDLNGIFEKEGYNIYINSEDYDYFCLKSLPKADVLRWSQSELKKAQLLTPNGVREPQKVFRDGTPAKLSGQTHIVMPKSMDKLFSPFLNNEFIREYTLHFPFNMYEENLELLLNYLPENYYTEERIEYLKQLNNNKIRVLDLSVKISDGRRQLASKDYISPVEEKDFFLEFRHSTFVEDFFLLMKYKKKMEYVLLFLPKPLLEKYDFDYKLYNEKLLQSDNISGTAVNVSRHFNKDGAKNLLVFGAPGTGKSHWVKENYEDTADAIRVTFHEEYSYQDFVGTLKPNSVNGNVSYEYKAGPFTRILALALSNPSTEYNLIIEELNRANAAAVFGDLFQLLDRDEDGKSTYSIENEDISRYIADKNCTELIGDIRIPSNLNIIATMNSADQGVFALDTAFKRRWSFKYVPIEFEEWHSTVKIPYYKDETQIYYLTVKQFIETINEYLSVNEVLEINEDRLIGPYFVKESQWSNWIEQEHFQKVLNYLWDDIARIDRSQIFIGEFNQFSKVCTSFKELKQVFHHDLHHFLLEEAKKNEDV